MIDTITIHIIIKSQSKKEILKNNKSEKTNIKEVSTYINYY